jgi:hypothetical protein
MCPACFANTVTIAVAATSAGGFTAFVANKLVRKTATRIQTVQTRVLVKLHSLRFNPQQSSQVQIKGEPS